MEFIAAWGYVAIAVLMAAENACIPIPSELILGFAGYLIFDGQLGYAAALAAGMIGGMAGSLFAYAVGDYGGRSFVGRYGVVLFVEGQEVGLGLPATDPRRYSSAPCCPSCALSSLCRRASRTSMGRSSCC